jgi:hypothetical protein
MCRLHMDADIHVYSESMDTFIQNILNWNEEYITSHNMYDIIFGGPDYTTSLWYVYITLISC